MLSRLACACSVTAATQGPDIVVRVLSASVQWQNVVDFLRGMIVALIPTIPAHRFGFQPPLPLSDTSTATRTFSPGARRDVTFSSFLYSCSLHRGGGSPFQEVVATVAHGFTDLDVCRSCSL